MESKSQAGISNISLAAIALLVAISVGFSFYKYYVKKDYLLYIKEGCDPSYEECLVEECDREDPRCLPSENGLMYYKEVYQKANSLR